MSGTLHDVRPRPGSLPTGVRSAILGLLLLVGVFSTISEAKQDFTFYSQKLYISAGAKNTIGGFKSGSDTGAAVSFERRLDTGSGGTVFPSGNGPRPHSSASTAATLFTMNAGQTSRFGAYDCKFDPVGDDQPEVKITTLIMPVDAYVIPESPTKVAAIGESVTLTMNTTTSYTATQEDLRWKHDGEFKTEWNGQAAVTIFSVQATDAGIYECYEMLRHGDQKHGIMKLIVRECGLYNWDPPSCNKACPACHNGGVCDDLTGECICAPGFSGDFCETLLGKNYFGQDGGITCSTKTDVACRNNLMCLPDPFGCTCAASFTGLNCESDCPAGLFGAGCRQRCHCASGVACNYGHGRCPGECENGYRGENCQNSCPYGQIGVNCIDCTVPVEVKNPSITSVNNQRVISWAVASNMCPVSDYTVQYELITRDQCQQVSDTFMDVDTTENLQFVLQESDLESSTFVPYSTYKIRVRARNEAGLGLYLNDVNNDEFITAERAPSAPPANVTHLNVTDVGAIIQWDEVPCGSRGGYLIEYSYELTKSDGTSMIEVTSARSLSFHDLHPCSDYTFRVAARTSVDIGVYSNEMSFSTEAKAHTPVENLSTNETENTLAVTWDATDVTENPCSLLYKIEYELINRDQCEPISSPVRSEGVNQTTPGITLDGLDAYSTYTVYVWTWSEAGLSEERSLNSTTAGKVPSAPPGNVTHLNLTETGVSFQWDEVLCGSRGGAIAEYSYELMTSSGNGNRSETTAERSLSFSDLLPCTEYKFKVAAKTSLGTGIYSQEIVFITSTKAHPAVSNLSTTEKDDALEVTWDATDVTENPCSLLYKIEYELINRDQCEPISSPVRSEGVNQTTPGITLDGLDAYSTYTVYVWTWSEAGLSEERSLNSTTAGKAPDESPAGFELADKTKTSIAVSWTTVPCGNRNGEIVGYWMRYKILDKPYDKSFDPSQEEYTEEKLSIFEKNVTGLKPSTQYDIQVAGRVLIGVDEVVGPYATMKIYTSVETDIEKPKEPTVDTSLTTSSTVTIALTPPAVSTYVTDFQIGVLLITPSSEGNKKRRDVSPDLYVAGEFSKDNLPEIFQVGDDKMYGEYRNKPLESSAVYDIYLAALSKTTDQEAAIAWGDPSRVEVGSGDLGSDPFPVAAVIVPILVIIVVGVVAGGLFLKRRANQDKQSDSEGLQVDEIKEEKQRYTSTHSAKDNFSSVDEGIAMMATTSINHPPSPAKPKPRKKTFRAPTAISLTEFEEFIHKKKAETVKEGNGFLWDFKNLPDEVLYSCSVAKEDENKKLNRYANIIPYDDSRVILQKLANDPTSSDYVNASYIDGFNAPKQYIATQGPNTASVPDMWRMIWQENCTKIVMLTNLLEGVKGKCEQYWPDKALSYGKITVTLVKEVKRVDYIIRDFSLSHEAEDQQSRKVRQFHYTTWPDMGLPQDPSKVVDLVKIVKEYSPNSCGPMVVHCSAGVGRTGTFIILDAMLDQAKAEGKVDVWNFARGMRDRRMKMIQTSAQYEFVFDALLDEFQCGDKTIKAEELRSKLSALKKIQASSHKTGIQLEFESLDKLASHTSTSSHQYRGGQDPDNVDKNRFPEIVPVDRLRPRLMTAGGAGTTDYINASFLNSYSAKSGYITTQMPLPQTVGDLWRMAYDYNATFIVMLNSMDDKTFADYLPTKDEPSTVGPLSVTLESTDQLESGITMRKLKLTNQKMKESRKICHLQLSDWPDVSGVPASPISTLQAVTAVHQWQKDHGNEDRIIIHCIDGVRASGTFCALLNIMAKLKDGNVVDVYRAVMKVKGTRAGMVPTLEHYSFLYGAVQNHLDTSIVYENL
ncbi:receptor-type tyrosine-protein phosphatase T-like isoform X3 [Asterias amurensis]|uniref:receptor-type tyrosine-protein phosphatase T-like isoform X3 n=1 Tax=Asterias amurensis TaxID=7602 RepID=UPI003AB90315